MERSVGTKVRGLGNISLYFLLLPSGTYVVTSFLHVCLGTCLSMRKSQCKKNKCHNERRINLR
jgi:hypothetical protein